MHNGRREREQRIVGIKGIREFVKSMNSCVESRGKIVTKMEKVSSTEILKFEGHKWSFSELKVPTRENSYF